MPTATLHRPAASVTPDPPGSTDVPARRVPRRRGLRILGVAVVAGLLGVEAVLAAPYLSSALAAVEQAADSWVGLAVLATAGSLTAFALVRRRLLRAAGLDASTTSALGSILVANAFHMTLPGGVAFSTGYAFRWLCRHGADPTVAGWNLAVNGLLSTAGLAALGVVASLLLGTTSWVRLAVEIVGVALVGLVGGRLVRHPDRALRTATRVLGAVNRMRGRPGRTDVDRLTRAAEQLRAVRPTARDWTTTSGYAVMNWLLDLACLAACAHAVGLGGLGVGVLLTTYVAGSATSSLSLLPGGIGTVDAALVLGLVAGGAPTTAALSAVVLYRLISLVGVVVVGWVVHAAQTVGLRRAVSVTRS